MDRDLQAELDAVLGTMRNVVTAKLHEYGDDRYREEDPRWAMIMCYSDVYRKHLRLRRLTDLLAGQPVNRLMSAGATGPAAPGQLPSEQTIEALRDCYLDMANYAAMGLQQINHHYPADGGRRRSE